MIDAQNTFYITLRDRLAALNPERTFYLRGITRPGIYVEGNELVVSKILPDVFVIQWSDLHVDWSLPQVLIRMQCTIRYKTSGTSENLGMDRGVMLAQMDEELTSILEPNVASKVHYQQSTAVPSGTPIFWTEAKFEPVKVDHDSLLRTAAMLVYSYESRGEP